MSNQDKPGAYFPPPPSVIINAYDVLPCGSTHKLVCLESLLDLLKRIASYSCVSAAVCVLKVLEMQMPMKSLCCKRPPCLQ